MHGENLKKENILPTFTSAVEFQFDLGPISFLQPVI
jgi:hypothetical protein